MHAPICYLKQQSHLTYLIKNPQILNKILHHLSWADTDNRRIISMKLQGVSQTPQDIMEEYNGCSVGQYTAYRMMNIILFPVQNSTYLRNLYGICFHENHVVDNEQCGQVYHDDHSSHRRYELEP